MQLICKVGIPRHVLTREMRNMNALLQKLDIISITCYKKTSPTQLLRGQELFFLEELLKYTWSLHQERCALHKLQ